MADEWTALHSFWNGFGLSAYDEFTVPDDAQMPYITYESAVSGFDESIQLSASLYYRSTSWTEISQKASEIYSHVSGGTGVDYDHGRLWITAPSSFATRMDEPDDQNVRRIVLQIVCEFQTVR